MTLDSFLSDWRNDNPRLLVHTSGSTGSPQPLWVEKRRMEASARITCRFLGLKAGDTALLCLPLDYIAGKMMVVRALVAGLRLISVPPSGHPLKSLLSHMEENTIDSSFLFEPHSGGGTGEAPSFAAMVPLQVWNSLQVPEERERLMQIRHLIIGGGAIDEALARELRAFPHAVYSTYGMTETLSHIALRRLSGEEASEWYTPFDGVSLSANEEGCLVIDAPEVCAERLVTHDIVAFHPDGRRFRILGRSDNVICSGGIKIQAEEVERLLQPYISQPFYVTRTPDARLGEAVTLVVERIAGQGDFLWQVAEGRGQDLENEQLLNLKSLFSNLKPQTSNLKPRKVVWVDCLPMTETGKPRRNAPLPDDAVIEELNC
ncbi:MAG: AMP-binding protein [Prevotella sp.]|nr:AMP-binding protein [Prevotella sp.]